MGAQLHPKSPGCHASPPSTARRCQGNTCSPNGTSSASAGQSSLYPRTTAVLPPTPRLKFGAFAASGTSGCGAKQCLSDRRETVPRREVILRYAMCQPHRVRVRRNFDRRPSRLRRPSKRFLLDGCLPESLPAARAGPLSTSLRKVLIVEIGGPLSLLLP